jgi:uncharacterized damage-inducible protein DinB
MTEQERFAGFWAHEARTTRTVFGRIPEGSDYRPDPKSRTAQQIAWQMVNEERFIIESLETGRMAWTPQPMPPTMAEICAVYDTHVASFPARWRAVPKERWDGTLDFGGTPRSASAMAWSFLFDLVHHRGQITTYLRPMGSTVPQIYGPSGDEP